VLTERRVRDWLRLLGFEIAPDAPLPVRAAMAGILVRRRGPLARGARPATCGAARGRAYLLKARKRVAAITPIRPVWQRAPKIVGSIAKPTSRSAA
jgi:hypothetical protein